MTKFSTVKMAAKKTVLLASVLALLTPSLAVFAATTTPNYKGAFLKTSQNSTVVSYVDPTSGQRYEFNDSPKLWAFIAERAVVAKPSTRYPSLPYFDYELKPENYGKFLTPTAEKGRIWYISPATGYSSIMGSSVSALSNALRVAMTVSQQALAGVPLAGPAAKVLVKKNVVAKKNAVLNEEPFIDYFHPTINVPKSTQKVILKADYKDAQMGWDFASSLWRGYNDYTVAHNNDWPDIKYFDTLVSYNLPIYLNEKGFTLDKSKKNDFVWSNFSAQWQEMYRNHFSSQRVFVAGKGYVATMKIQLPSSLQTEEYGLLPAGTYYFTTDRGFLNEADYLAQSNKKKIVVPNMSKEEKEREAKRVVKEVKKIMAGIDAYRYDVHGYPVASEKAIVLGIDGQSKALTKERGFVGDNEDLYSYTWNIWNGSPTTEIVYDSRYAGGSYVISFNLFGQYDKYEPGQYEATPLGIRKVADVPLK